MLGTGTLFCLCSWACELSIFDAGGGSGFAAMRGGTPLQDGSSYQEGSYEHSGSGGWGLDDEEEGAKKRGRKVRATPATISMRTHDLCTQGFSVYVDIGLMYGLEF